MAMYIWSPCSIHFILLGVHQENVTLLNTTGNHTLRRFRISYISRAESINSVENSEVAETDGARVETRIEKINEHFS